MKYIKRRTDKNINVIMKAKITVHFFLTIQCCNKTWTIVQEFQFSGYKLKQKPDELVSATAYTRQHNNELRWDVRCHLNEQTSIQISAPSRYKINIQI